MTQYYLQTVERYEQAVTTVLAIDNDGFVWSVPEEHRFYDEYLAWVAEGNTAEEWTGN